MLREPATQLPMLAVAREDVDVEEAPALLAMIVTPVALEGKHNGDLQNVFKANANLNLVASLTSSPFTDGVVQPATPSARTRMPVRPRPRPRRRSP